MNRKLISIAMTVAAFAALGTFSSSAFAAKEKPVKTSTPFTAEWEGGEYFGEHNILTCKGVHRTNSVKYPGIGNHGGEDVEHCKAAKGEVLPVRWMVPGQPINIDDNFWRSDDTGQEVPFNEDLPRYGVKSSKVSANGKAFKVVVIYPLSNFSVSVSQEISGSEAGFTSAPVTGLVGQTVDYQIAVKNTGWVSLEIPDLRRREMRRWDDRRGTRRRQHRPQRNHDLHLQPRAVGSRLLHRQRERHRRSARRRRPAVRDQLEHRYRGSGALRS